MTPVDTRISSNNENILKNEKEGEKWSTTHHLNKEYEVKK